MDDRSPYPLVTRDPEKGEPSLNGDEWVKRLAYGGGTLVALVSLLGYGYIWVVTTLDGPLTGEASNTIGQIAKLQVEAYAAGTGRVGGPSLCKSAPHPVPKTFEELKGRKHTPWPNEWYDGSQEDEGFRCLQTEMTEPQYYQYDFASTGPQGSFTATARGDLDGDGVRSEFSLSGRVDPTRRGVILDTSIHKVRPKE